MASAPPSSSAASRGTGLFSTDFDDWGTGLVLYPTDTFYALGADPRSDEAVAWIFDVKGRPAEMAIPLIASSTEAVLAQLGALSPASRALASAFWPGPLSLIVDAPASIARAVHAGRGTVAVRVPALPLAREVAGRFHGLVTATSANRSGEPAARTVAEAGAIARDPRVHVVDGGATTGGAASTIVDARGDTPVLIRAGAIAWDRVLESLKK